MGGDNHRDRTSCLTLSSRKTVSVPAALTTYVVNTGCADAYRAMVAHKKLAGRDKIGVRVGRVINKYKVAKHFELTIEDHSLAYRIDPQKVMAEAALDGIYVLRTPLAPDTMDAADIVRSYKSLANVERAFRSLKTIDLKVRPIHHRLADRVRAHILLCMLAYYVEWHMREAWRTLLFAD